MQKQKRIRIRRNRTFFSWLFTPTPKYHEKKLLAWGFIFFVIVASAIFIFAAITGKSLATALPVQETTDVCTKKYGYWSACDTSGKQTRSITVVCGELKKVQSEQQSCSYVPPPCTGYGYGSWSDCQNGYRFRDIVSRNPSGCNATDSNSARPLTKQACVSSSSSSEQTADKIQNVRPEFTFSELPGATTLKGNFTIKGRVDSARKVEFYSIVAGSNTLSFLGSARNSKDDYWEFPLDTTQKPNGAFYLVAKIKNDYGSESYESKRVQIYINNLTDAEENQIEETDSQSPNSRADSQPANPSLPQNFNDATSKEWQEKYFKNQLCLDKNYCSGEADPDKDGLNNNDEFRYRTNPLKPDTDGDGFLDGDEIKNGFNPLQFSPGDKSDRIIFESPKENGEIKKEIYQISAAELVSSAENKKELRLSGKGLPNSFITIYIYSDLPIILTIKTDSNGNWSYVLDKQLADGQHEVYVVVTDNTGKITAKSEPLFFVKTAEAITVIPSAEASLQQKTASPVEKRQGQNLAVISALIVLGLIASLTAIKPSA
mgnify:FL=1